MISRRLLAIANYINKTDSIIDVGCDHGYLAIHLVKNKLCNKIVVSDIRQSALNNAISHIKEAKLTIPSVLSNGLNKIDTTKLNTIVISGMGTKTIIEILSDKQKTKNINKIIIQSNNNLEELRKNMLKIGYYLYDETTVFESNIWYVICCFKKGYKKLPNKETLFGLPKEDKIQYYNYLIDNYNRLLKIIPKNKFFIRLEVKYKKFLLNKLLKECR